MCRVRKCIWHSFPSQTHLTRVTNILPESWPDIGDLYQMRPSGTRMNVICKYSNYACFACSQRSFIENTWIYCNLFHVNIYCVSHQASTTMIDALFNCTLILENHDNNNCGPHWIVYIHHVIAYSVHCSITPCVPYIMIWSVATTAITKGSNISNGKDCAPGTHSIVAVTYILTTSFVRIAKPTPFSLSDGFGITI